MRSTWRSSSQRKKANAVDQSSSYEVRSRLVHGSRVNAVHRRTAEINAADLVRAIVRKSIEVGWPDRETLDQQAMGTMIVKGHGGFPNTLP